jgi:hypothetical protein
MADATTLLFKGISSKENEIHQQAAQPTKTGSDLIKTVKSGLGPLCTQMKIKELLSNRLKAQGNKDKPGKAHTDFA